MELTLISNERIENNFQEVVFTLFETKKYSVSTVVYWCFVATILNISLGNALFGEGYLGNRIIPLCGQMIGGESFVVMISPCCTAWKLIKPSRNL